MASENNLTAVFTDIANAIRDKKGSVNTIKPINMADEINSIQVGDTNFKDLVERTITNVDDDTITVVGNFAFRDCNKLTSVSLPQATSIGDYAFQKCSKLTSINFPNVKSVGSYVFYECSSLTSANFPLATSVGSSAFQKCSSLVSVDFPLFTNMVSGFGGISSLTSANFPLATSVGNYSFQNCSKLANINISSVTSIGSSAFQNCELLTTLILRTNQVCTLSNTNSFTSTPIATSTTEGYIYVPLSLVENYRDATNWITYKNKIMPIDLLEGNYVEVDLGTLNWTYNANKLFFQTSSLKNVISMPTTTGHIGNIMCDKYGTISFNNLYNDTTLDMKLSQTSDNGLVQIRNLTYTDPTAFKNAMSGVILRYLPKE